MKKILSYFVKSIVKWGAHGVVVFVTKEARECNMKIGDPVVVSVVQDDKEKYIMIKKPPVKIESG
jgi:hypothetical protein